MTQLEFENHAWKKGSKIVHNGIELEIDIVDFMKNCVYVFNIGNLYDYEISLPTTQLKTTPRDGDGC
jgi:hypothetical protein